MKSIEDIRALKAAKISGVIVGKAIYTGALDLKSAIDEAENNVD